MLIFLLSALLFTLKLSPRNLYVQLESESKCAPPTSLQSTGTASLDFRAELFQDFAAIQFTAYLVPPGFIEGEEPFRWEIAPKLPCSKVPCPSKAKPRFPLDRLLRTDAANDQKHYGDETYTKLLGMIHPRDSPSDLGFITLSTISPTRSQNGSIFFVRRDY
ncbi:hypothetical protein C8F04DRAFT_1400842 [Mycena alexandri]|uniref:Uncharacterized protein n=1 Tax=Mycena alexandri TaxID=1745969 RepID=A0AAD6SCC5_9AGAR|nr:hypothetical protein C8F04DRAFT_1400842 [Mycena alexandri]